MIAAIWPVAALAVEITEFDTVDEQKKLTITITFSDVVDAEVVHHYASNFVEIMVPGLKLKRNLTRKPHVPENEETLQFFQATSFTDSGDKGKIRLQLGKYASPGDVQVVELDDKIVVDLVKPYYKLPKEPVEDAPPVVEEDPPVEFIPDSGTEPVELEQPATEDDLYGNFDLGTEDDEPEDAGFQTPYEPADPVVTEDEPVTDTYGGNSLDTLRDPGDEPLERPVRDFQPTPSYKNFDLDDVPVAQLQLRNMPFNEALMELTAGSGFNVVVGTGVSDELMTLDFRQKELSLKRALDLLCMAYDLAYTVEDDAVVIRAK